MANVFEVESNASQDANYREHLNRNWQNGNTEFDKIEGLLNTLEDGLNDYRDEIHQLQESFNNLKEQHTSDVDALNQRCDKIEEKHNDDIKAVQEQLDRLNNVVFGHVHEVNYDKPRKQDPHDYYEVIDKSKNRHPLNKDPVSHELNYSTINGKHNSIEIDTGIGHMKGEKL